MAEFYQPAKRSEHSTIVVDENLYLWGGNQSDLPRVHSSAEKKRVTSYVDVFQCRLGMWDHHPTTGKPPLGVYGYASACIGRTIFYFAGKCGHGQCEHNSLNALNIDDFTWSELFHTSDIIGPMRKHGCGLLAFHGQLLAVGGRGYKPPRNPSPSAKYEKYYDAIYTNEHHVYSRERAQWIVPVLTGDIPPALQDFSFTQISTEQAVMFGGLRLVDGPTDDLRIAIVSSDSVHWQRLAPCGPDRPTSRYEHATICFTSSQLGLRSTLLLVVGGYHNADSWICDIKNVTWKRISGMPDNVEWRYRHSISAVGVSDSCIWVMVVGGITNATIYTFPVVALLELTLTPRGHWEITSVKQDKEIYASYVERFTETFPALMSAYVHKQQQQNESLGREMARELQGKDQQLQLAQQQCTEKERQVDELQQQLTGTNTEKTQLELSLKTRDVELTKKQDEISDLSQQLENVKELPPAKKYVMTQDSATQAKYLSVTGESVRAVKVCGETVLEITGSKRQKVSWEGFGFHLTVPDGAVSSDVTISLAVKAILAGQFEFPDDAHLVSAIYWVSASELFHKQVSIHIQHCAIISSEEEVTKYKFLVGKCSQESLPYTFKILDGVFSPQSQLATISVKQFSFFAAIFRGWWANNNCQYTSHYYLRQDPERPTSWKFLFVLTPNLSSWLELVKEEYKNWMLHLQPIVVEFEVREQSAGGDQGTRAEARKYEQSITLEITPPDEGESKYWDIYSMNSLEIDKQYVDSISKDIHTAIAFCQLAIDWNGPQTDELPIFKRRVNLVGAKAPNNFFTLQICPPSSVSSQPHQQIPRINSHTAKCKALERMCNVLRSAIKRDLDNISFELCAKELIPTDVRDYGQATKMVSTIEKNLAVDESVWDKLMDVFDSCNFQAVVKKLSDQLEEEMRKFTS